MDLDDIFHTEDSEEANLKQREDLISDTLEKII
jgi:hypothetical protein